MKRALALIVTLIGGTLLLNAQTMTPELLWKLGRVSLSDVSEDGSSFLYTVTRYDIESNESRKELYLMDSQGGEPHSLAPQLDKLSDAQFVGDRIGFSHDGQFHLISRKGENRQAITAIPDGMKGLKAYPQEDGSIHLLFTKEFKTQSSTEDKYPQMEKANVKIIDDLMYRHWDHWEDEKSSHLCYAQYDGQEVENFVDLQEGEPYDVPLPPFGGASGYTLSPDGASVIYESKKLQGQKFAESTNSQLYEAHISSGTTELLTEDLLGYDSEPQFSPEGRQLAWLSMATDGYESDVSDLLIRDRETGEQRHVLREAGRYDDLTIQHFAWLSEQELVASIPYKGSNQLFRIQLRKNAVNIDQITEGDYNYNKFLVSGKHLLVERQDMNHATEIFRVHSRTGKEEALTAVNADIYQEIQTSKVEERMIETSDGQQMHSWVIYPPDFDPEKSYPTLLYCQGGPQAMVSQFYSFRWNFQLMAAQGYIVIAPNRRGLPGFGREWNEAISGDWGGQPMNDYLSAIDDIAQEPYVDQESLGCVGASYGGYSVFMLAGLHEGRFQTFISHAGLFDLESWYLTTEEMFFANYDLGGPFWKEENSRTYSQYDPKTYLKNWNTPIMILQGGKDFRVPESQGMEAFNAAQMLDIPSRFVYFPEENHWILSPQNGLVWHREFFEWLNQWL